MCQRAVDRATMTRLHLLRTSSVHCPLNLGTWVPILIAVPLIVGELAQRSVVMGQWSVPGSAIHGPAIHALATNSRSVRHPNIVMLMTDDQTAASLRLMPHVQALLVKR